MRYERISPPAARRRGGVYVAVLGVAMIVTLIGVSAMHLQRVEVDVLSGAEQVARAELLSQAAVEFAIGRIKADSNWRTTFTSGAEVPPGSWTSLGSRGGFKFKLVDADGNLADDDRDAVTVHGIGRSGEATQVTTLDLLPANNALDSLNVSLHAANNVMVYSSTTATQMVSSNANVSVSGAVLTGDAWAVGDITGSVTGTKYKLRTPARRLPDSSAVWIYYLANGTRINVDNIPGRTIEYVVLSAGNNPYGAKNPQGIYIIDCKGQSLTISKSRINATLVVLNVSPWVVLENKLSWAPPAANFPALMVSGSIGMSYDGGSPLSESSMGVNYNPPGSPYENVADNDLTDSYPGVIKGVVYASDHIWVSSSCSINGTVIAGQTATLAGATTLTFDSAPATYPPPGFSSGKVMRAVPRSWQRVAR